MRNEKRSPIGHSNCERSKWRGAMCGAELIGCHT
jgi:hypothetical protein